MNHYEVTFEIFGGDGNKAKKTVTVEAGNKKIAIMRGIMEINKIPGYSEKFKNVTSVKELDG